MLFLAPNDLIFLVITDYESSKNIICKCTYNNSEVCSVQSTVCVSNTYTLYHKTYNWVMKIGN